MFGFVLTVKLPASVRIGVPDEPIFPWLLEPSVTTPTPVIVKDPVLEMPVDPLTEALIPVIAAPI